MNQTPSIASIQSFLLRGVEAVPVTVECQVTPGIGIHLVGEPDAFVKESLLRTITAMQACGYRIPGKKVVVNICHDGAGKPHSALRGYSGLDLPLALAILVATDQIHGRLEKEGIFRYEHIVAGELGLDGSVRDVPGAVAASEATVGQMILPEASALRVKDPETGLPFPVVYKAASLKDAVRILEGDGEDLFVSLETAVEPAAKEAPILVTDSEIRAVEIAALGGFDLAIVGHEGSVLHGPIRLLSRLLNPYNKDKAAVYDATFPPRKAPRTAPLRIPHPFSSFQGMLGGGPEVMPGEVTLAHGGVLVLQDIHQWPKSLVEAVGRVHEDGEVKIARLGDHVTMPAGFRLAVMMRGDLPADEKVSRLLGVFPFVQVQVSHTSAVREVTEDEINAMRRRIDNAWRHLAVHPASIPSREIPLPDPDGCVADRLAEKLIEVFGLSARDWSMIYRLALTIAALDGKDCPYDIAAVCEATSYLFLQRKTVAA